MDERSRIVRPNILLMLTLTLSLVPPAHARTFTRTPLASEVGLDALTRRVSRERVGRDLFANPVDLISTEADYPRRVPELETAPPLPCGARTLTLRAWLDDDGFQVEARGDEFSMDQVTVDDRFALHRAHALGTVCVVMLR